MNFEICLSRFSSVAIFATSDVVCEEARTNDVDPILMSQPPCFRLPQNVRAYIDDLASYVDAVVISISWSRFPVVQQPISPLHMRLARIAQTEPQCFPSKKVLVVCGPNLCLDFGSYWRLLVPVVKDTVADSGRDFRIRRIILANDSCLLVRPLDAVFRWAQEKKDDLPEFWGVTLSRESALHVQSYFMVFDGSKALRALFDFVKAADLQLYVGRSKQQLISAFEIGLSVYMKSVADVVPMAMFSSESLATASVITSSSIAACAVTNVAADSSSGSISVADEIRRFGYETKSASNPSYRMWHFLVALGCPLIKKRRRHLPNEDAFIARHASPELARTLFRDNCVSTQ